MTLDVDRLIEPVADAIFHAIRNTTIEPDAVAWGLTQEEYEHLARAALRAMSVAEQKGDV